MNYAEQSNRVWIIEVRVKNGKSVWNKTWMATGLRWHMTRKDAKAEMPSEDDYEYRVRRYVRKP